MATALHTFAGLSEVSNNVAEWVAGVQQLTQPDRVYWCDGSDAEERRLRAELLAKGELQALNQASFPGCYLYRSDPKDVARVEHLTYICSRSKDAAGPNNNWMEPSAARAKMRELFRGSMRGRTMYVVPYCMGPLDSPYARCGVEITDSAYVVLNMAIMTRMGRAALERIATDGSFVRGLHSIGDLDPARRFIMHYPEELAIESFGSGYGGNALLGKKCHALRIASWQARDEGWLAEHMLIVGLQNPRGETHYVAAAFPVRLRQDQSCDADPAGFAARAGRCSRSAMTSPGCSQVRTAAVGHQSRVGLFRCRARHQARPIATPTRRSAATRCSPTSH